MGKKRVFIIHGWEGTPEQHWIPWLKKELEKKGIFVKTPQMKDTNKPNPKEWVTHISKLVENHHSDCYLVGHSLGANAILRYLNTLEKGQTIGGALFIAPSFLRGLKEQEKETMKEWLTHINVDIAKRHVDKSTAIFSDSDKDTPLEDAGIFRKTMGSKIIIEHNKGHFTEEDGIKELPSALKALLQLMNLQ